MKTSTTNEDTMLLRESNTSWYNYYMVAGAAAFVQLLCIIGLVLIVGPLGVEPTDASSYFQMIADNRLEGILRMDFLSLINVCLFLFTAVALFQMSKRDEEGFSLLALLAIVIGVAICVSIHQGIAMLTLSDKFAAASTDAEKAQYLAAGEAILVSGWWGPSTGGLLAGVFLQGGMVVFFIVMLKHNLLHKITAVAGLMANGLDFIHIFIGVASPSLGFAVVALGGLFYVIWYPALAWDLLQTGRKGRIVAGLQSLP